MEIRIFEDITEYYDLVSPFLMQNEAKNNLMLALLNGLRGNPLKYGNLPILIAFLDNNSDNDNEKESGTKNVVFAGMRTPPHNQILAFTDNLSYVEIFASFIHEQNQKIPGVLGFKEGAKKCAQKWKELTQIPFHLDMHERIYELLEVNPRTLGNHEFRQVTISELDLIVKWSRAMQLEAVGRKLEEDDETMKAELLKNDVWKTFYVLSESKSNGLLTMAKKSGTTPTGQIVNYVYTPPELRRNGYATECVAKLSQMILDEGKLRCLLFTDLDNPTSNKIYQNIGYVPVVDIDVYKFG
ncbi:MAG: GNAT family N-acetyltransferase [Promethearchaeota archaeon]